MGLDFVTLWVASALVCAVAALGRAVYWAGCLPDSEEIRDRWLARLFLAWLVSGPVAAAACLGVGTFLFLRYMVCAAFPDLWRTAFPKTEQAAIVDKDELTLKLEAEIAEATKFLEEIEQ